MILQIVQVYLFETFLILTTLASFLALRPLPSSLPLIALLALLRLETALIIPRPWNFVRLVAIWASIFTGCIVSFVDYLTVGSSVANAIYAVIFSSLGLIPVIITAAFCSNRFVFPALWATWWLVVAQMSRVGRLGAWSPLTGDDIYSWLRPYVSDFGIDWIIGASAEVLSFFMTWYILGFSPPPEDAKNEELDRENEDVDQGHAARLVLILIALSIPSSFTNSLPEPLHEDNSHDIGISCVLPTLAGTNMSPLEAFLEETTIVAARANVALWPEGAVFFASQEEKESGLFRAQNISIHSGVFIGVSFIEPVLEQDEDRGKTRSGIVVLGRDGVMMEYYERHPAPFNKRVPDWSQPEIVNITYGRKGQKHFWEMRLSAGIGFDFAHPYAHYDSKPHLILAPARTNHRKMAQVMMETARHRAQELGTTILWCDGGDSGLSGLVGSGHTRKQVGPGTWIERMVAHVPKEEDWTLYGRIGALAGVVCAWTLALISILPSLSIQVTVRDRTPHWDDARGKLVHLLRWRSPRRAPRMGTLIDH